jgi:DNA-binding GntR family transcriptional regulator
MTENLRNSVYPVIRRLILLGEVRPGDRLNAADLARRLGISHIPVREALSQLQREGLVEIRPGQGAFACAQDLRQTVELFHLRQTLEAEAAALAARRADAGQIDQLRRTIEIMEGVTQIVVRRGLLQFDEPMLMRFGGADLTFHRQIVRITANREMLKALGNVHSIIRVHGLSLAKPSPQFPGECQATHDQHRAVFDAIAAGDPRAARLAMLRHFRHSRKMQVQRLADPESAGQWCFPPALFDTVEKLEAEDRLLLDGPGHATTQPGLAIAS